jgi:hypothetical protein
MFIQAGPVPLTALFALLEVPLQLQNADRVSRITGLLREEIGRRADGRPDESHLQAITYLRAIDRAMRPEDPAAAEQAYRSLTELADSPVN